MITFNAIVKSNADYEYTILYNGSYSTDLSGASAFSTDGSYRVYKDAGWNSIPGKSINSTGMVIGNTAMER